MKVNIEIDLDRLAEYGPTKGSDATDVASVLDQLAHEIRTGGKIISGVPMPVWTANAANVGTIVKSR